MLLLLLVVVVVVVPPNRLGVGVEEAEVVVVGLLAIKENAGFGAAEESVGGTNSGL